MRGLMLVALCSFSWFMTSGFSKYEKMGLSFSEEFSAQHVRLLVDETWVNAEGTRHVNQEIFDSVFQMIDQAEDFILIDFFLINDFLYEPAPHMRQLSQELTDRLVEKRKTSPAVEIFFISDPVNTVYGALESPHFKAMEEAGIRVVLTDLDKLRDSNPIFSKPWRLLGKPFGTGPGKTLGNPMGEGRVSMRSMLKLMNFKANHRKIVITEKSFLVTSANPHSGSSAHWNTALRVDGAGIPQALKAEIAILNLSGAEEVAASLPSVAESANPSSENVLTLLTERKIKEHALELLAAAQKGDRIDLIMFYFSDGDLIHAFIKAQKRGCDIRMILDPNRDAFGREKNGVPNRQTARKLVKAGIPVRWADTHGEQCHTKMLYVGRGAESATLLVGSSNYTRRNMDNYNAECNVAFAAPASAEPLTQARAAFERWWTNADGRIYTTDYATYKDHAIRRRMTAWVMEKTGLSTF